MVTLKVSDVMYLFSPEIRLKVSNEEWHLERLKALINANTKLNIWK